MNCHKCNHENAEGAKFCSNCATQLYQVCPSCNATNIPIEAKFCPECGTSIRSTPQKLNFQVDGVPFNMIFVEHQSAPYYIGETPVTVALWNALMKEAKSTEENDVITQYPFSPVVLSTSGSSPFYNHPITNVSIEDINCFISKISNRLGERFSLPSEEQWEFAAKGGVHTLGFTYAGSNDIDNVAWCNRVMCTPNTSTTSVMSKKPNELGIYDMSGNVFELCSNGIARGGSWKTYPIECTLTHRNQYPIKGDDLGFRLIMFPK